MRKAKIVLRTLNPMEVDVTEVLINTDENTFKYYTTVKVKNTNVFREVFNGDLTLNKVTELIENFSGTVLILDVDLLSAEAREVLLYVIKNKPTKSDRAEV